MNTTQTTVVLFSGIPLIVAYSGEGLFIILGNSVTAFIFLKIRRKLKRASYLLINLTVADFFVGISIFLNVWKGIAVMEGETVNARLGISAFIIDLVASTASLLSLSLISVERMVAVLWPFRHRLLETWYYFAFIGGVWLLATANTVYIVTSYLADGGAHVTTPLAIAVILSILITTASYLAIWMSIKRSNFSSTTSRTLAKSKKLAKTLFIVTIISIITWLPVGISLAYPSYLMDMDSSYMHITLALQYASSFVNPIVYCFKMPEFKQSFANLFCCCHTEKSGRNDIPVWVNQGISLTSYKSVD